MSRKDSTIRSCDRRGSVIIMVAGFLLPAILLVALVIDIGYMAMTKTQLQAAADSAALAGGTDLAKGLGGSPLLSVADTQALARQSAVTMAGKNRAGDKAAVYCNGARDVQFGNAIYNTGSSTWTKSWGTQPYNMIGVTLLRNQAGSANGDAPLPLFFSGIVGATASLTVTATAALMPSNTIQIIPGSPLVSTLMPLTVDKPTWDQLLNNSGGLSDNYNYHSDTNTVTNGSDGIKEIDLYPNGVGLPGNRGLIDLGTNGASALGDQIRNGVTYQNLVDAGFPNGTVSATPTTPLVTDGTTGLKNSLQTDLTSIIGQARTVAVFSNESGTGTNAVYTVVKFVGIRIVAVSMNGNPKHVWAQPATVVDATYVPKLDGTVTTDSVFSPVILIQ